MVKILTLRNIITLSGMLFLTACSNNNNAYYSSSGELKSISSEDKNIAVNPLAELRDPESGQIIYFVAKK